MVTLAIHDRRENHGLVIDLRHLLTLVAPLSLTARWTIKSPQWEDFWATGEGGLRLEKLAEASAEVGGDELLALANETEQVIWGDFVGNLTGEPNGIWMTIRAVDSSYFEVETTDREAIAKIKARFSDVRIMAAND